MRFKILGIEKLDYISKRTGRPVRGTNLYCQDLEKQIDSGIVTEKLYVKEVIDCSSLQLDDCINVYYNQYGNVDDVRLM